MLHVMLNSVHITASDESVQITELGDARPGTGLYRSAPHYNVAESASLALAQVHLSHNCITAASIPPLLRAFAEHGAYPRRYDEDCFASWVRHRGQWGGDRVMDWC